jgi:CHAD domain-containing protein
VDTKPPNESSVVPPPTPAAALLSLSPSQPDLPSLPISASCGPVRSKPSLQTTATLSTANSAVAEVGPFLSQGLKTKWMACRDRLEQCRSDFSNESVHELRVASRRLAAHLVLIESISRGSDIQKIRRALKQWLSALRDLRDAQVQRKFLDDHLAAFPELLSLRKPLKRRERQLAKSACRKLRRAKTKKLEESVATLAENAALSHPDVRHREWLASSVLRRITATFAEVVIRRQSVALSDLATIHRTRVAFKKFRYMVESVSPVLTGLSPAQLRVLARYQRRMGAIQDLVVMQDFLVASTLNREKIRPPLQPFSRYLRLRRARTLHSFLSSADQLLGFWPPAAMREGSRVAQKR